MSSRCIRDLYKYIKLSPYCWEWAGGCRTDNGYPICRWENRTQTAYRVIYKLIYGEFDKDLFVCHRCDNPKCVRPDHLFLGTHQDNMDDMKKKGRSRRIKTSGSFKKGNEHKLSKLNSDSVIELRNLYNTGLYSFRDLGKKYGISYSQVSRVVNKIDWRHV